MSAPPVSSRRQWVEDRTMLHRIVRASARPDYTVALIFDKGEHAVVDVAPFVATGAVTAPLRADPDAFVSGLRVVQDGDTIGWPGEVEIDAAVAVDLKGSEFEL